MITLRSPRSTRRLAYSAIALLIGTIFIASACSSSEPSAPPAEGPAASSSPAAAESSAPTAPRAPAPAAETPTPATPPPRSDVPDAIEGANRTMEKAAVNGFETSRLQCKTSGGLFAGMGILGGLASQKQAFEDCSTQSQAVRVHFVYDGTNTSDVRVADVADPTVARCVADAVTKAAFPSPSTCIVSFKVGPPVAAAPAEPAKTPAVP